MNVKFATALEFFEKQAVGANIRRMMQLGKAQGMPVTAPAARRAAMYLGGAPVSLPTPAMQNMASQARSLNAGPEVSQMQLLGQQRSDLIAEFNRNRKSGFNEYIPAVAGPAPVLPSRWQQAKAVFKPQGTGLYQKPVIPDSVDDWFNHGMPKPESEVLPFAARASAFFKKQPAADYRDQLARHTAETAVRADKLQRKGLADQEAADWARMRLQKNKAMYSRLNNAEAPAADTSVIDRRPQLQHTGTVPDFYDGPEPTSLYKGISTEDNSLAPAPWSLYGKGPTGPAWYSGHPEISAGYAKKYNGIMLQRPLAAVKQDGPVGPFSRHVGVDTRAMDDISSVPAYDSTARRAGLSAEAESPYYERVGTWPASPRDLLKGSKVWRPHPTIPNQMYQAADFSKFSSALEFFEKQAAEANTSQLVPRTGELTSPQQAITTEAATPKPTGLMSSGPLMPWLSAVGGAMGLNSAALGLARYVSPSGFGGANNLSAGERKLDSEVTGHLNRVAENNHTSVNHHFDVIPLGSVYVPSDREVRLGYKGWDGDAGILAHELGHSTQSWANSPGGRLTGNKAKGLLPSVARLATAIRSRPRLGFAGLPGHVAAYMSSDEELALAGSGLSAAVPLATLVNEYDASRRGAKLIDHAVRKQMRLDPSNVHLQSYLKKMQARPYAGLGTYAGAAAATFIPYIARKARGDFNQPEIKQAGVLQSGGKLTTRELLQQLFRLQPPSVQSQAAVHIPAVAPMNRRSFLGEISQQAADKYAPKLQQDIATAGKYHELGNKIPQALKYFQQKAAQSKWRTADGLKLLLGNSVNFQQPRLEVLEAARNKVLGPHAAAGSPAQNLSSAIAQLPKRSQVANQTFDTAGEHKLFRGVDTRSLSAMVRGQKPEYASGYFDDAAHASPHFDAAKHYGRKKNVGSMIFEYDAHPQQLYYKDFTLENVSRSLKGGDLPNAEFQGYTVDELRSNPSLQDRVHKSYETVVNAVQNPLTGVMLNVGGDGRTVAD